MTYYYQTDVDLALKWGDRFTHQVPMRRKTFLLDHKHLVAIAWHYASHVAGAGWPRCFVIADNPDGKGARRFRLDRVILPQYIAIEIP